MRIRDFFALKVKCGVCDENTGLNRFKTKNDAWICPSCYKQKGIGYIGKVKNMTLAEIKNMKDFKK